MRTTLTIDDDILRVAKALAEERQTSIGAVLSELARKGLIRDTVIGDRNGFPVFSVPGEAYPITLEDVKRLEDEP